MEYIDSGFKFLARAQFSFKLRPLETFKVLKSPVFKSKAKTGTMSIQRNQNCYPPLFSPFNLAYIALFQTFSLESFLYFAPHSDKLRGRIEAGSRMIFFRPTTVKVWPYGAMFD